MSDSATPWTVAHQAPPTMEFSRQEYWSGLPFPSPGDLPNPGIKPRSPTLRADALPSEPPGSLVDHKPLVIPHPPTGDLSFTHSLMEELMFRSSILVTHRKRFTYPSKSAWAHTTCRFWCFPNLLGIKVNNSVTRGSGQPGFVRGDIVGQPTMVCQMLRHPECLYMPSPQEEKGSPCRFKK